MGITLQRGLRYATQRSHSQNLPCERPDFTSSQAIVSPDASVPGFTEFFIPGRLHSKVAENVGCKPLPGGSHVQNIPHRPVYPAGSAVEITLGLVRHMSHYRYFVIETYENRGEPSSKKIRARPLSGQGVSPSLNVECSVAMREAYPPGTLFKVDCKVTDREGTSFLYRHFMWPYEVVTQEQARQFIEGAFAKQPRRSERA